MKRNANVGYLLKTNIRQNSLRHLLWMVVLVGVFTSAALKFHALFSTEEDIAAIVTTLKTPAMVSLFGEFTAPEPYRLANVFASEMLVFMGMFMVFMNISLAIKNTRMQEDSGLLEMVRARKVGRYSFITATLVEMIGINLVMGILYTAGLGAAQLDGATRSGDILMGGILAFVGIAFGCSALLFAQLANNARSATFISYLFFGICYLIRMLTDTVNPAFTWLSPFGWIEKTEIYTKDNYLPMVFLLLLALVFITLTYQSVKVRDIQSGWITLQVGKEKANRFFSTMNAFVFTTEKNSLLGWLVGVAILGASYGSIFNTVGDILGTNPTYQKLLGISAVHEANEQLLLNFLNMLALFFIILGALAGISAIYRLQTDEKKGYLEIIHAKAVSKTKIAMSYFLYGLLIGALVFSVALASAFFTGNALIEQPIALHYFFAMLGSGILAVEVFLCLAILLVGAFPKWTLIGWLYLGVAFLATFFAPLLNLSTRWSDISPLGWIKDVPMDNLSSQKISLMIGLSIVFFSVGIMGYRNRDI
ncbi:MAG: ABC transporter permease [Enterococcus sp.]